jgi:hypothetical protein
MKLKKSEFNNYTLNSERDDILGRIKRMEKKIEEQGGKIEKWEPKWSKTLDDIDFLR